MGAKILLSFAIVLAGSAIALAAPGFLPGSVQGNKPLRPSPPAHADCKFQDGATINVDYSSPRMKGRKVYGELVPLGKVWRAGANEATTFVVSNAVHIGSAANGLDVPAGSYTLFVIPNKPAPWTLIVSKKTGEWGIPYPGDQFDLGRTEMGEESLPSEVENFTIDFVHAGDDACMLAMRWETTGANVKIIEKK
jgi:hypothetical protein